MYDFEKTEGMNNNGESALHSRRFYKYSISFHFSVELVLVPPIITEQVELTQCCI